MTRAQPPLQPYYPDGKLSMGAYSKKKGCGGAKKLHGGMVILLAHFVENTGLTNPHYKDYREVGT